MVILDGELTVEEPTEGGPTSFIIKLCTVVRCCISNGCRRFVQNSILDIFAAVLPYLQITQTQYSVWISDGTEYLQVEEEVGNQRDVFPRIAGMEMINELIDAFEESNSVIQQILENNVALYFENTTQWRYLELALWLVSIVAGSSKFSSHHRRLPAIQQSIIMLGKCLTSESQPLLQGRAFLCSGELRELICLEYPQDVKTIMRMASKNLAPTKSIVVRLAAARTVQRFIMACSDNNEISLTFQSEELAESLCELTKTSTDKCLYLCFEVEIALLIALPDYMNRHSSLIGRTVSEAWKLYNVDPLVHLYFQEFLSLTFDLNWDCMDSLLIPDALAVLSDINNSSLHQIEISLNIIQVFLNKSVTHNLLPAFPLIAHVLDTYDEPIVVQTACEALGSLVVRYHQSTMPQSENVQLLLRVIGRLLRKVDLDDSAITSLPALASIIFRTAVSPTSEIAYQTYIDLMTRGLNSNSELFRRAVTTIIARWHCSSPEEVALLLQRTNMAPLHENAFLALKSMLLDALRKKATSKHYHYQRNVMLLSLLNGFQVDQEILKLLICNLQFVIEASIEQEEQGEPSSPAEAIAADQQEGGGEEEEAEEGEGEEEIKSIFIKQEEADHLINSISPPTTLLKNALRGLWQEALSVTPFPFDAIEEPTIKLWKNLIK